MTDLPIHAVLPELLGALRAHNSAVLIAPPGAGKTTSVAPSLLGQGWCSGKVILLSPRRVAARAAAERMAELLGEKPGETVGYLTRLDSKMSGKTRIVVMTEAIFVAQILDDPELAGVSAVLFDEAHERHLDSDLGLALAVESQQVLRDDLRLIVMSATIDGTRFAGLLGDAPVVESEGKAHPLRFVWLGSRPELRVEDAMTSAILTAWREEQGDILAFLPGVGEIERTRERLAEKLPNVPILPLHGQVEPQGQHIAIKRDSEGRRRIVLATSIAETSLTLDGVSVVVDSGLARRAEFDLAAGVTHLVTTRASQASAAQRAGRAARQGPGVAYRLWEEGAHAGRPAFDPPEMLTADLAPLVLALAQWGAGDPAAMAWIDPPPAAALSAARGRLAALGALDGEGRITEFGRKLAQLPMEPPLAAMVLFGAEAGDARGAARLALLLQERGLGGRSEDLAQRLSRWNGDRSPRAEASRKLADGWAKRASGLIAATPGSGRTDFVDLGTLLARALPDNLARRRDASGESWISAGGRGYTLDPASPLARAEWLAIGDAQGRAQAARITAAWPLSSEEVERDLARLIERRSVLNWNAAEGRVEARLERRLGAITLASGPDPKPDPVAVTALLVDKAREKLADILPKTLMARARHAGLEALSLEVLAAEADDWLAPLLEKRRDLDLPRGALTEALLNRLDWDSRQKLDRLAPREWTSPAGTQHAIDYDADGGPSVEVRVQALFGLDRHPMIGQPPQPLLLQLTSPGGRPVQATRDLPAFWRGSWRDVVKDMKGRYPKHRWPDEPWAEAPSLKTKNAFNATTRT
ncbi:ATP-dependent helicase HrpB [Altererythrobacter sp. CC-YST694]|uniref:ATP-dependent helicase HrpB n=1 Tax=Altererythrobacter sp. CC-YST694 TaxID=2755038 RepID=UPI001D02748D|nr:ATP-dependent helicase HrpB [Altererythrobacter sp. CC-YST694]MCB5424774.1 ATP-dependent helicase HrpB [Altererythrobacter sp. CC-YST694]